MLSFVCPAFALDVLLSPKRVLFESRALRSFLVFSRLIFTVPRADNGNSSLRKTSHILLALSRLVTAERVDHGQGKDGVPITYFALDLEKSELERTLELLMATHGSELSGKVDTRGMWGTYEGGLKYVVEGSLNKDDSFEGVTYCEDRPGRGNDTPSAVSNNHDIKEAREASPHSTSSDSASSRSQVTFGTFETSNTTPPSSPGVDDDEQKRGLHQSAAALHLLFLGSSLGNFDHSSSVSFLRSLPLLPGSSDTLLIGLDHDNEKEKIELAYNDPKGISKNFMMNGLRAAGRTLGDEGLFAEGKWEFVNMYNEEHRELTDF